MIENLDFDVLSFRDQQVNDYVQKSSAQFDFSNVSGLFNAGLNPTDKTWPDKGSISYKVLSKEMLLQKGYLPGPLQQMQFSLQLPSPGRIEVYLDTTAETDFPLALIRRSWTFVGYLEMNGPEGIATLSFLKPYYWSGTKDLIARIYFQNATGNDFAIGTESTFATNQDFSMMDGHVLQTANNCSVRVPKVAFESIDQEISIGFWAFGADTSANVHTYFANGADASGSRNINIHLPWENNEIYWDCGGSNGSFDRINVTAQPADCYGRWNYWMFTKDASKGIMEIFLNGNKVQSGTGKTQPIHLESLQFLSAPESATGWFGMVDEITIWSKRLTEAQVDSAMLYSPLEQSALDESLEAYYDMNTPSAVEIKDLSPKLNHAKLSGIAQYLSHQKAGAAYSYNSENMAISMSPVIFDADRTEISRTDIFDTFPQAAALLKEYEKLDASTISLKSQVPVFLPAYSTTKTANGEILSKIWQASTDTIHNSIINYLRTSPSKFQLLSFVTPYGNGLNLGAQGRTWYFDMTEYAPVLRGNKFLSMEDGGQNQEEMDLTFYYIKGRPARKVLDITNVYRPGRGYIQDIIIEKVFPVKSVQLPQADQYVLRAEITGHGQDGEFIPRMHQISLNGGTKLENFEVWKACGAIPVYPQGGTWIFDRAGWCPGDPSDVHHFDITQQVSQME
ncbi:MAG: LamG-like jellyroll fold domain-containing protein, partial [Saprospiraceae bacterium]